MRCRFLLILGAAGLLAQTPAPKPAAPKPVAAKPVAAKPAAATADPVVFQVGEEKLTRTQFDRFLSQLPPELQREAQTGGRRRLAERLAELKAFAAEARQRGMDQKAEVRQQIALQTENVLASALYQQLLSEAVSDAAAVQKYYEEHKKEYEQATARHILIRFQGSRVPLKPNQKDLTEAEALAKTKDLAGRIQKGEDFAMLAQAESDDTGTAASGGSLGSFGRGQMVPEFDRVVFSQPLGQLSEPVRTQFGYHLIKVEQRGVQTLEQVKPVIEQRLKPQGAQKMMDEVKKKFAPVLDESYFGPAAAPAPPPAAAAPKP